MEIKDLIESIQFKRDRAYEDWKEDKRIAGHSAYGVGVDQGRIDVCDELLEEIKELNPSTLSEGR